MWSRENYSPVRIRIEAHIPVLNFKSLINMKKKSGREQDLLDIDALELLQK